MASSSVLAAARRLLSLGRRGGLLPVPPSRAVASSSPGNSAEDGTPPARPPTLGSTLWPLGSPGTLLVPEIERWAAQPENRLQDVYLRRIVRELRTRRRHRQALEVSEWMNLKGHVKFEPMDHAVHLDLIGHIHGVGAAETYFNNLSDKDKKKKPYGALLNCYTRELLVDKALAHFQKMKELGFVFTALPYNNLMSLYTNIGQHERVPLVMAEMKSNGIVPDNFSYRICINSYGTRADLLGLENTLQEMEQWAAQPGNSLQDVDLRGIVRELRTRHRHRQALEVSEWMNLKGHVKFEPMDHAVHLDLIGHIHGVGAAETYFNNLSDKDKKKKPYGALLNCYTRELLVDKALAHFQKMKELGFVLTALPYNNLMCLYINTGQHERVPLVMAEMKSNGIVLDKFSYNLCINAFGTRADFLGLENTLKEMDCAPQVVVDWDTYVAVASYYIKGDLREKAYSALLKAEAKMGKKDFDAYRFLISMYGQLGDKSEVKRLWALQMLNCKRLLNANFTHMLAVLVKLDEIMEAEDLLKEWESSKNAFTFEVPNILLKGYCQRGLLEKAEALLDGFLKKGKIPTSTSWAILASAYAEKGDVARAYELTKNALYRRAPNSDWIPKNPSMIKMILKYLGGEGEVKDVEAFIDLLKVSMPMDSDMTEALSRARAREEKKAEEPTEAPREDITA